MVYTCNGETEKPNRKSGATRRGVCAGSPHCPRLEGCRAETGHGRLAVGWLTGVGVAVVLSSGICGHRGAPATEAKSKAEKFPDFFLFLSSSLFPVPSMDTRGQADKAEQRKRKEKGSEATRPRTYSLVLYFTERPWQYLGSSLFF